jgi:serine protease
VHRKHAVLAVLCLVLLIASSPVAQQDGRYMIKFKDFRGAAAMVRAAGGAPIHEFAALRVVAARLPQQSLEALRRNPNVEYIENDQVRAPLAQTTPYGVDMVQARDVWDANRDGVIDAGAPTGAGRLVCVIDSGLYTGHEDFAGVHVTGGYPAGWDTDGCGHGTHVSGTVAAQHNSVGVVGVSPGDVSLFVVRVFDNSCNWAYSSDLIDALNRCESAGANIVSMSLGGSFPSPTEEQAFQNAYDRGVLHVAAAGNGGNTLTSYPAGYGSVISVAAVDATATVASFSQQNSDVELAAPGVGVLSTVPWKVATVHVDGVTYMAAHIENAARASVSGALVDGGRCNSVGTWSGKVVLCERGDITFFEKVTNVQSGGGVAAVIYNNVSGNFLGTLGPGNSSTIPAVSLSQEDGKFLVANKLGFTAAVDNTEQTPASGYEAWNGTSMATPHVSAVAAVIWSGAPTATNAEVRDAMNATALDKGAAGRDHAYGYGIVQAKAALDALLGGPPPSDILDDILFSSPVVGGCKLYTGKVTLNSPAGTGGQVVNLTSENLAASVPAQVTVAEGKLTKSFTITTSKVLADTSGNIVATVGTDTASRNLTVRPIGVKKLTLDPTSVKGGDPSTGTVKLECAAGPGLITVSLASDKPNIANPAVSELVFSIGEKSKTFTVNTSAVSNTKKAKISATANGVTKSATLTVNP